MNIKKLINDHLDEVRPKKTGNSRYGQRHTRELSEIEVKERPRMDRAMVTILTGLIEYAEAHHQRYDDPIGNDPIIGEGWLEILGGLRQLLNGETGNISAGDFDTLLKKLGLAFGFEPTDMNSVGFHSKLDKVAIEDGYLDSHVTGPKP